MERGYAFVMVDLRGFGGSTGCLDWGGPGEQSDVVNAVQWAAAQPWSTGKVGMYGKSYDGVTGLIGVDQQPAGLPPSSPRSRSTTSTATSTATASGARTRSLTPALYDLIDLTPGPLTDDPGLQPQRGRRHPAPGLPGRQLRRPGRERRPRLGVLDGAQPDPGRHGLRRAAVPDPGPDGEQHRRRRHRPVPAEPHRLRARLARPVGARPRQRDRRERPPEDGPRRLVRRGHALLRPVPEGRHADGRRPAGRGADQRRQVARRAELAAGRRDGVQDAAALRHATPTTARPTRPATARRRASGRSRRRWRMPSTCRAPGAPRSTSPRRCPTPTSCSTSTTSTRTAPDR